MIKDIFLIFFSIIITFNLFVYIYIIFYLKDLNKIVKDIEKEIGNFIDSISKNTDEK